MNKDYPFITDFEPLCCWKIRNKWVWNGQTWKWAAQILEMTHCTIIFYNQIVQSLFYQLSKSAISHHRCVFFLSVSVFFGTSHVKDFLENNSVANEKKKIYIYDNNVWYQSL